MPVTVENVAGAALGSPLALARIFESREKQEARQEAKEKRRKAKDKKEDLQREKGVAFNGAGAFRTAEAMQRYLRAQNETIEALSEALDAMDKRLDAIEEGNDAQVTALNSPMYSNGWLLGDMDLVIEAAELYIRTINIPDKVQSNIALQVSTVMAGLSGPLGARLGIMTAKWMSVVRLGLTAYAYWRASTGLTGLLTADDPSGSGTTPTTPTTPADPNADIEAFLSSLAETHPDAAAIAAAFLESYEAA